MRRLLLLATMASLIGGCVPKRILVWSPDGQRAAVITKKGLHLADADGHLSAPVDVKTENVAWLPNSRELIADCQTPIGTWDEAEPYLTHDQRRKIHRMVDSLRAEILNYEGKWEEFSFSRSNELTDGELIGLLLYVRDKRNEGLAEKLKEAGKKQDFAATLHTLHHFELIDGCLKQGRALRRSLNSITDLRVSPDGRKVLCAEGRLVVIDIECGKSMQISDDLCGMFPDWTPDSRSVVWHRIQGWRPDADFSATIERVTICSSDGQLLPTPQGSQVLIHIVTPTPVRIRCLRDGRILFSSPRVSLPDIEEKSPMCLFEVTPGKVLRRIDIGNGPDGLPAVLAWGFFEVSPDEKRVLFAVEPESLRILELATGHITPVLGAKDVTFKGLSSWKSSEEISFTVAAGHAAGSSKRPEFVLWSSDDKIKCLSRSWPDFLDPEPHR